MSNCDSDEITARMIDANGDGRIQSTEFVNAASNVLRREALSLIMKGEISIPEDSVLSAGSTRPERIRQNADMFRTTAKRFFPNGIDRLSESEINSVSELGAYLRNVITDGENSFIDQGLAGLSLLSARLDLSADYRRERAECNRERR